MRVGVVGPEGPDYFAENIADALRRMGNTVIPLGPAHTRFRRPLATRIAMLARQALTALDEWAQHRIVRAALDADCEVVINIDAHMTPDAVTQLRSCGVRVAFWFPDAMLGLGRSLMLLAPYDALFFKEPHLVERLQATLGLPAHYLPEACNPRWHRPIGAAGRDPYLVVAGNMYPSRVRLLERLTSKGIPLRLYGPGFPRWIGETTLRSAYVGRCIAREEKAEIFRSAVGVLNNLHPAEVAGVNARLFEAAGSGAAVLTEFRPVLPDLFAIGREVLTFHDYDELVDQASRLLSETGLTTRLGDAAARRAHQDHTYEVRLTTILEKVS